MKILFVGSNPKTAGSLELEREITELQQRLLNQDRLGTINLRVLPGIDAPNLIAAIADYRPDILHVVAHADEEKILLSDADQEPRLVPNEVFVELLESVAHKPKLIFVSACSSGNLAKALLKVVPSAIGTESTILNTTARRAAVVFYEWLARGYPLQSAVNAAKSIVKIEQNENALIFEIDSTTHDPRTWTMVEPLRILACFPKVEQLKQRPEKAAKFELKPDSYGQFQIEFGIVGCPSDTRQIVFFVDDEDFTNEGTADVDDFAWIDRCEPDRGERWLDEEDDHLLVVGDCRLHAALITRSGTAEVASSWVCDALERYYFGEQWHRLESDKLVKAVKQAIAALRDHDGSRRHNRGSALLKRAKQKSKRKPSNKRRQKKGTARSKSAS